MAEATALRTIVRVIYSRDGAMLPDGMDGLCTLVNVAERFEVHKIRDAALARLLAKCRYGECNGVEVLRKLNSDVTVPLVADLSSLAYTKELSVMSPLERGLFSGLYGDLWTPEPSSVELMERFQSLPASAVVAFVTGPELCSVSEDLVWLAVSSWVHHNYDPPAQGAGVPAEIEAVLGGVHWARLSRPLIENVVEKDVFVRASANLAALLQLRKTMGNVTDWQVSRNP